MNSLLALRQEHHSKQRKLTWALAGAACLILVAGLIGWWRYQGRERMLENAGPAGRIRDLVVEFDRLREGQLV